MAERVRPADVVLLHDPQTAGMIPRLLRDRGAGHLARARWHRPAQRPRARGLALLDALRRAGRRLRLLASSLPLGRARSRQADGDRALDRPLLAEEPRDGVHQRDRGAARRRTGRRPPPRLSEGGLRAARRHGRPRGVQGAAHRGAATLARRPAARAGLALGSPEGPPGRARRVRRARPRRTRSRTSCWRAPT